MNPRWLFGLMLGLAAPMVHAQTTPVASPEAGVAAQGDYYGEEDYGDEQPLAPTAPPALPQETPTARPYSDAVWTSGHWYWDESQWRYKSGAWVARMQGYQFVNGYWASEGNSWRWIPGGWAQPGSTVVEIPTEVTNDELSVAQAPPPLRVETQSLAPAPDYEWAPGYWYWTGSGWDWISGNWVQPPRPGLVFVSPYWTHRGGSYVFIGGGWAMRGSRHVVVPYYRHAGISVRWGHPNYFVHRWSRYPTVHHYNYRPRSYYRAPSYRQTWSPPRTGGSYYREPDRGRGGGSWSSPGRGGPNRGSDRGGYDRGGGRGGRGDGGGRGDRGGGGGRSHDASPVR